MRFLKITFWSLLTVVIVGCTSNNMYSLNDPALSYFKSMYEIEREQFCLTEIDKTSVAQIEESSVQTAGYDVMLHLYANLTSRHIAFIKENNRYVWIGEQEIDYSGRTFLTPDGWVEEHITISYFKHKITGAKAGSEILYTGDYQYVDFSGEPTCEQALFYIKEWSKHKKADD